MWPFDSNQRQTYEQYAQAYDTGNFDFLNPMQALNHLRQFIQGAPPQLQQQVYQQHFSQLPYEHRQIIAQQMPPEYGVDPNDPWSLSQGLMRLGQEQPHMIERIFNHPMLLGGAVVLTALAAKHILAHHHEYANQAQYNNQQPYGQQQYSGGNQQYNNGYDNQYANQQYNTGSGNQYGNPYDNQYAGQQGYQGEMQQELNQERRREQELRRELRQEERRVEEMEGERGHHHHHREEY